MDQNAVVVCFFSHVPCVSLLFFLAPQTGRKKGADDEDENKGLFLGASAASKKKGPKPESKAPKAPKKTALTHTPNVFEQFDLVGLLPPLSIDGVQSSLEEVCCAAFVKRRNFGRGECVTRLISC
jgi:hypothetical protein